MQCQEASVGLESGRFRPGEARLAPTGELLMRLPLIIGFLLLASVAPVSADSISDAAQQLAKATNETDPNAFWLMMTSIGMLFVCALTLIMATSFHVFRRKPTAGQSNSASGLRREASSGGVPGAH